MGALALIPLISGAIDLIVKLIAAYSDLPDGDVAIKARLEALSDALISTVDRVEGADVRKI